MRPKETVNDLGQPVVSPRGRDVTFSSVVMVWSYFVAVAICVLLSWVTGTTSWVALNHRNVSSHHSGGYKSKN